MEEDFFLKNMKGVKPFKKDVSMIDIKIINVSAIKVKLKCFEKKK